MKLSHEEVEIKAATLTEMSSIYDRSVQMAYLLAELRILNHNIRRLIDMQPEC